MGACGAPIPDLPVAAVAAAIPWVAALTAAVTIAAMSTLWVVGGRGLGGPTRAPRPLLLPPPLLPSLLLPPQLPPPPSPLGPVIGEGAPLGGVGGCVGVRPLFPNRRGWGGGQTGMEEVSPPRMRKVEYVAGKVRWRWEVTVPRVKADSSESTGRRSRQNRIGSPTNLSLSLLIKLVCVHWKTRSVWGLSKRKRWGARA